MTPYKSVFEAIGTQWVIDIEIDNRQINVEVILSLIRARIEEFDKTFSRFREDSLICKMSREGGTYELSDDFSTLLSWYKDLYEITDGLVTPLIGSVLEEAGYDAKYSLIPQVLHKPPTWDEIIVHDKKNVTLKHAALLDFGACGKGLLVDIVSDILKRNFITSFCVDAGGDIYYENNKGQDLRVGLEHPEQTQQVIGVASLYNQSICGSATNRRAWGTYHHIINPHTLAPCSNILAVWSIAKTALLADAMTTCLFFTDGKKLKRNFDFEYLILYPDYTIEKSDNFPGELFYQNTVQ